MRLEQDDEFIERASRMPNCHYDRRRFNRHIGFSQAALFVISTFHYRLNVLLTLLVDTDHLIEEAQSSRFVPLERIASDDRTESAALADRATLSQ
jgi:hypothetical protein